MDREEAIRECERWFAHLEKQKEKSIRLQELAAHARKGKAEQLEAQAEVRKMDRQPRVYDGSRLADAVRVLIKEVKREQA